MFGIVQDSGRRTSGNRGSATRFAAFAIFCLLPLMLALGGLAYLLESRATAAARARLTEAVHAAARAADAEIMGRRLVLQAFGGTIEPQRLTDLAATDRAARRIAEMLEAPVGVLDRGLSLLVDTSQPFGTPLASTRRSRPASGPSKPGASR